MKPEALDKTCVNAIRFLSADAVQKANSGHPGAPMGAAPMTYVLWDRFLKHNPRNPAWSDRDRFILSAGHASALLYSLLHLTGYDLSLDDIKEFRQWGSRTPGHPEHGETPGVEATTGPLGQGLSHAVGMAIAESHLAATYNRPGFQIVDHYTYVLASDGDLMEGVAAEACSLAGHLRLGKLIVLYDDNHISLAGATSLAFTEDVSKRFEAYGWSVQQVADGEDLIAISAAIQQAKSQREQPHLICVRTIIGRGAPTKQNTFEAHGSPLGADELRRAKEQLGWPAQPDFFVPADALNHLRAALEKGHRAEAEWQALFVRYQEEYPELAAAFQRRIAGEVPPKWDTALPAFAPDAKGVPTRKASEAVLQALAARIPEIIGGSADLNPSTFTWLKAMGDFQQPDFTPQDAQGAVGGKWGYEGRNIHFGVREHAMGAVANGMALHGGFIPYTATFATFADYMRPPMRLAALMGIRVIYVFTHDSIALGEDGPTHQPVEQIMNLRAVPNLTVIRPSDAAETVEAWRAALLNTHGPTALFLTRQNLPTLDRAECAPAAELHRGAYALWQSSDGTPALILIATGSETHLALQAAKQIASDGILVRVVAMPSWELFERQPREYRDGVLPPSVRARVAIEAGAALGWEHYVGLDGAIVGLNRFGASAPGAVVYARMGFTVGNLVQIARKLLDR